MPPGAALKLLYARLVDEPFRLSMAQIAELTDRQIAEIYFYPRDEKGRLLPPSPEMSEEEEDEDLDPEQERALLFGMGSVLGIPEEQLKAAWEAKHGTAEQ